MTAREMDEVTRPKVLHRSGLGGKVGGSIVQIDQIQAKGSLL